MVPKGAPKLFQLPDSKIRFFVRLSGFLKTIFLNSTRYKEFPGAKIFPDKKYPVSGFYLNRLPALFLLTARCLVKFKDAICSTYEPESGLLSGCFIVIILL